MKSVVISVENKTLVVKEPACQCRRRKKWRFDPWVGKILWRRAWQIIALLLARDVHPYTEETGGTVRVGAMVSMVAKSWTQLK